MNIDLKIKKLSLSLISAFIALLILLLTAGCSSAPHDEQTSFKESVPEARTNVPAETVTVTETESVTEAETETVITDTGRQTEDAAPDLPVTALGEHFDFASVPGYSGKPFCVIDSNVPDFGTEDLTTVSYEYYSELDELGRCGVCVSCAGKDLMPTEERGSIGQIKPTGWHTVKYSFIDGNYLYNRCHLIAYQIAGENANVYNLITGTRYMNKDGMLPFENMVTDYVNETENHVMYRSTPVFVGDELLARGVHIEAYSVEDGGEGVCFNVFCYNVQPGVTIDYADGESRLTETETEAQTETADSADETASAIVPDETIPPDSAGDRSTPDAPTTTYILNTNTKKFHYPYCKSVNQMKEKNKQEFTGTRDEVIAMGYDPCGNCNP